MPRRFRHILVLQATCAVGGCGGAAAVRPAQETASARPTEPAITPSPAATTASTPATAPTATTTPAAPATTSAPSAGGPTPNGPDRPDPSLTGYEPTYLVVGPAAPNVKFQFSVKFRLFSPDGPLGRQFPPASKLYLGYTQVALWDVEEPSQTTLDTTFQPELFYATHTRPRELKRIGSTALGLQAGVKHESNGRSGPESRNVNYVYAQPTFFFGQQALHGEIGPRIRGYFADADDNPDINEYIGQFELHGALRFGDGLHIDAIGRLGEDGSKGAVQFDITYPLRPLIGGGVDTYFHVQYFNGFAETLLDYREHHQTIRAGISFVR